MSRHQVDHSTRENAYVQAGLIKDYWLGRGYRGIKTWVIAASIPGAEGWEIFSVRSSIGPNGFPPKTIQLLAA